MKLLEKEIALKLIQGEDVVIIDNQTLIRVRKDLRNIKQNVNIVLSQINEIIKKKVINN